jgi:integrase
VAADGRDAESRRRRETIEVLIREGAREPTAQMFAALAGATLSECSKAYALHGFDMRRVTEARRGDVVVQLNLAIAECGGGDKIPAALDGLTIDHALRRHSNSTARKRISALRGLYRWLCRYGAATENPAEKCASVPPPPARERYADDRKDGSGVGELQALWNACDRLPQPRADFLRLLILLPLRRDELADAKVSNISTNLGLLQIMVPKPRSKTGTEHRLPIVGEAAAIVNRLLKDREPENYLIPLTATGNKFDSWKSFQEQVKRESGQAWFYFHSMRKMFSTEATEHGLEEHAVIDGMLNHAASLSVTGSARSYNFAKMMPRRAELLREWERVVLHSVGSGKWPREESNVIGFDPAARGVK